MRNLKIQCVHLCSHSSCSCSNCSTACALDGGIIKSGAEYPAFADLHRNVYHLGSFCPQTNCPVAGASLPKCSFCADGILDGGQIRKIPDCAVTMDTAAPLVFVLSANAFHSASGGSFGLFSWKAGTFSSPIVDEHSLHTAFSIVSACADQ